MKKRLILVFLCLVLLALAAAGILLIPRLRRQTRVQYTISLYGKECTGHYSGDMTDDRPDGYGVFTCTNDAGVEWHYIGDWKNGCMDGQGGIYWNDGNLEYGLYSNGSLIDGYAIGTGGTTQRIQTAAASTVAEKPETYYVGNINSLRFHDPECESVGKMRESNKVILYSRTEAIEAGYRPCGACDP